MLLALAVPLVVPEELGRTSDAMLLRLSCHLSQQPWVLSALGSEKLPSGDESGLTAKC